MTARGTILREGALWGTAATVVLAAHLGSALWLMQRAEAATPPGLAQPVYVDLAPAPTAAAPEDIQEAEDLPEPEPEIAMPPLQELEPVPDMNSLFPPPPDAVVLQKSERPPDRPTPPEKKIVEKPREKKPEPELKKPKPAEQPASRATTQVRAPQGERSAAPATGQPSGKQVASWQSRVQSAVARHMQRTRVTGHGGSVTVNVRFSVDSSGNVAGAQLVSSTGDARNDTALNRQAARLPRLPAHPSGKSISLTLPVRIVLR